MPRVWGGDEINIKAHNWKNGDEIKRGKFLIDSKGGKCDLKKESKHPHLMLHLCRRQGNDPGNVCMKETLTHETPNEQTGPEHSSHQPLCCTPKILKEKMGGR